MLFFPSINISECCWIVYPVCVCVCERRCFCKCVCVWLVFATASFVLFDSFFFVSLSNIYISLLHLLGFLYNRFTNLVSFNELFCFFFIWKSLGFPVPYQLYTKWRSLVFIYSLMRFMRNRKEKITWKCVSIWRKLF